VGAEPEGVNLARDGGAFYVTSEAGNAVTVLDARSFRALARIEAGARPRSTAFSPDGTRAFVMNEASANVTVIDASALRAIQSLPLPERSLLPMSGVLSPDSATLFVSTGRGGRILAMNSVTGEVRGDLPVGARPWGLAISADGSRLYSANGPSDDVTVIDARKMQRVATVKVGKKPWGIACQPEFIRRQ
jgi:YVTN family beta-propeller protein